MTLRMARFIGVVLAVAGTISCGNVVTSSRSPVLLVIDSLQGIRGAATLGTPGNPLISDVITNVTTPDPCKPASPCPTIFSDSGQVTLRLVPKDIGTVASPTTPSSNSAVTITRYHVEYLRADGRTGASVVPASFDGAMTVTVPTTGTVTAGLELVRVDAKKESPLVELRTN